MAIPRNSHSPHSVPTFRHLCVRQEKIAGAAGKPQIRRQRKNCNECRESGQQRRKKILQLRKSYGGFRSVDDLLAMCGLGGKSLEIMRKYLTVGKATAPKSATPSTKSTAPRPRKSHPANHKIISRSLEMTDGEDAQRSRGVAVFRMTRGRKLFPFTPLAGQSGASPSPTSQERKPGELFLTAPDAWAWVDRRAKALGRRCGCRSPRGRQLSSDDW